MVFGGLPTLASDEIDDLLYFTRINDADELQQTISGLVQKYSCEARDVLHSGVDVESGNTVLHYCSANGFSDLLPLLLKHLRHADIHTPMALVNHQNKEGNTPLHWAAYNGHLQCARLLISAGADMWIKNSAGHLAMFEAERAEKNDVVQYLLEAGGTQVERTGGESQNEMPEGEIAEGADASVGSEDLAVDGDLDMDAGAPQD